MLLLISVKGCDYKVHFWYMSKNDAKNITNNSNLNEKSDEKIETDKQY